jgi:hypothetical protein
MAAQIVALLFTTAFSPEGHHGESVFVIATNTHTSQEC